MELAKVGRFIIRHRVALGELSLIAACGLVVAYFAYAIDIFENEAGITAKQAMFELDETLAIGGLLAVALLIFGFRRYLAQRRETQRRIAAEVHIRELAYQDTLTGLPNRRQFDDAIRAAMAAPPGSGAVHGVFLLDLNGFKQINDVHGHGVGDEVLIVVAQRLLSAMREGDMVARFGGDEFAILATHLGGPEAATNVALRVIEALDAPIQAGGALHRVGVGIGVALAPADATAAEEALRKADVALYRAKAERRSALRFFEPEMDARVRDRATVEQGLRAAIDEGRLETTYRSTVDLATHVIVGFEAAPRWVDPVRGEVPPERFIAIAEETGLIHILAERTLRQACETARRWPAQVTVAVDIYPSQFKDHLLASRILRIVADAGLAPAGWKCRSAKAPWWPTWKAPRRCWASCAKPACVS